MIFIQPFQIILDEILQENELPILYAGFSPCFRREAGAAGKDTRGMIRQHQFYKVEMVSVTHPDKSWEELERMIGCAEDILKRLELPYRVVSLAAGDMSFSSHKTLWSVGAFLLGFDRRRFYLANAAGVLLAGVCVTIICLLIQNGMVGEDSWIRSLFAASTSVVIGTYT